MKSRKSHIIKKIENYQSNFYKVLLNYPKQFEYEPKIVGKLKKTKYYILCGMGGSHLAGEILKNFYKNLFTHTNYGLPDLPEEILKNSLIITLSHSGNTEETIDSFLTALKKKLNLIAISTNGKLLTLAQKHQVPYIQIPGKEIQPRVALGYHLKALLKIIDTKKNIKFLSESLNIKDFEKCAKVLSQKLENKIPIIYSSQKNYYLAYNFKIKINETSKIPAFSNYLPELNHNEMQGFENLSENFVFIFLKDKKDHPRIRKRMDALEKILKEKKLPVININFESNLKDIFRILIIGDFVSYFLANYYKVDPEKVPLIEEFKNIIKKLGVEKKINRKR